LLLGHGSGSFGHVPAERYATRQGVQTPADWRGFAEVWREARALDDLVIAALTAAGLPAIAFPPSAAVIAENGRVATWDTAPIQSALAQRLLPVIQGDVVFDRTRGGTILSTEELFFHLAGSLHPARILLAGIEDGVWQDYPARTQLLPTITPATLPAIAPTLHGSAAVDVTGGMLAKVESMLNLAQKHGQMEILIFSGREPGLVKAALLGANPGTTISSHVQGGH
jgi:isopentenyl phosphate kinase